MFTKEKPRTLNTLSPDKKKAIAEYILDYVKRNPGKQIPSGRIGEMCGTPAYNVSTIIKQLVRTGEIEQISRYTYRLVPKLPITPMPVQTAIGETINVADKVEALAKDYMWSENGSGTLKGFIDWLKTEKM